MNALSIEDDDMVTIMMNTVVEFDGEAGETR